MAEGNEAKHPRFQVINFSAKKVPTREESWAKVGLWCPALTEVHGSSASSRGGGQLSGYPALLNKMLG
jgi:hypothetical protein